MKKKIDLEWLVMENILNNMPSTEEEREFSQKYIEPNNNFELEDDMRNVLFAVDRRAFRAGFRVAMALVKGKAEVDINELIKEDPSPDELDMEPILYETL